MKNLLSLEEAALFAASFYFFTWLPISGWWYAVFFLAPDIGMVGYLLNPTVGAFTYNLLHHKAVGFILLGLGVQFALTNLIFAGLILLGHSAFDRVLGYGLKYPDHFKHTHLGWIGENLAKSSEKA